MSDSEKSSAQSDPSLQQPEREAAHPPPLIDTPENMPGDQPIDDTPPSVLKATGDA